MLLNTIFHQMYKGNFFYKCYENGEKAHIISNITVKINNIIIHKYLVKLILNHPILIHYPTPPP